MSEGHVELGRFRAEVESKLEFRGRTLATLGTEFRKKEPRLRKLWAARLAAQMIDLPEFDRVFRAVPATFARLGWRGDRFAAHPPPASRAAGFTPRRTPSGLFLRPVKSNQLIGDSHVLHSSIRADRAPAWCVGFDRAPGRSRRPARTV